MINPRLFREYPGTVEKALKDRNYSLDTGSIIMLEEKKILLVKEADRLKQERNVTSKKIGELKREGVSTDDVTSQMKIVTEKIKELDIRIREVSEELESRLLYLPNIPSGAVPIGKNEKDNVEIKKWGEIRKFDFNIKNHQELGETLGILNFRDGAKLSGSGFVIYSGVGARIERALINFMLDVHTTEFNYKEVSPPFLVSKKSALTTGNLPKFEDDLYGVDGGQMYLIPTAEVPVTNIHRDEILEEKELPIKYASYTPCFRREAGSWGKETKGLIRQHQFDKVELVIFSKPDDSVLGHEMLLGNAEEILKKLELPYRVIQLCTGDMGFSSANTYDIEVWVPSLDRYCEISSCSNFSDFQARRGNIRYRPEEGGKPELVHTINGSGLAIGRTLVAILENYQREDGSVDVPEVLRPYLGGLDKIQ